LHCGVAANAPDAIASRETMVSILNSMVSLTIMFDVELDTAVVIVMLEYANVSPSYTCSGVLIKYYFVGFCVSNPSKATIKLVTGLVQGRARSNDLCCTEGRVPSEVKDPRSMSSGK